MAKTQTERSRTWKEKNKSKVAENQRRYRSENGGKLYERAIKKRSGKIIDWYQDYKSKLMCSQCPENHPACLAFHHRDPSQKRAEVCHMVYRHFSIKTVMTEIAKCDVLCHNCHAKLHANDDQ